MTEADRERCAALRQAAIQICVDADAECKEFASAETDLQAARIWRARAAQARQIAADIGTLPLTEPEPKRGDDDAA